LPSRIDQRIYGIDSVQALELALGGAGRLLARTPEFRAGQVEQWDKPLKYDTDLFLPLPMQSLQGVLQNVRHYIERKGSRATIQGELLRSLLAVMREVNWISPRSLRIYPSDLAAVEAGWSRGGLS
jgi:hypothetical protein